MINYYTRLLSNNSEAIKNEIALPLTILLFAGSKHGTFALHQPLRHRNLINLKNLITRKLKIHINNNPQKSISIANTFLTVTHVLFSQVEGTTFNLIFP